MPDRWLLLTWWSDGNYCGRQFEVKDPAWREAHRRLARNSRAEVRIRYLPG